MAETTRSTTSSLRLRSLRDRAIEIALIGILTVSFLAVTTVSSSASVATPTFVQGTAQSIRTGTVNSVAFPKTNVAGDLVVAFVVWDNAGTAAVKDSAGNAYTAGTRTTWGNGFSAQSFFAKN